MKRITHTIQHEVEITQEDLIRLLEDSGYTPRKNTTFTVGTTTVALGAKLVASWVEKKNLGTPAKAAKILVGS